MVMIRPCEGIPFSLPFLSLPRVHAAPTAPGPFPMCLGYGLQGRGARGTHGGDRCTCVLGGGRPLLSRSFPFFSLAVSNWTFSEPLLTPGKARCLAWNPGHSLRSLNWLRVLLFQKDSPVHDEETVKRCFKLMSRVCQLSPEFLQEK